MKRNRTYTVATAPIVVPNDEGVTVLAPAMRHVVKAADVKYGYAGDPGYFQLLAVDGSTVFAAHHSQILWCVVGEADMPPMALVTDAGDDDVPQHEPWDEVDVPEEDQ